MSTPIPTLRIGKYKGKRLDQVPADYLRGLLNLPGIWKETREQIEFYLKSRPPLKAKDRLDYKPQYFKPSPPPSKRTEAGKQKFRELSRQVKERLYGDT